MLLTENKPLAPFTTFGIGGPARWFAEAVNEDEIAEAAAWAGERGVPLFVLGGGSNLLVSDAGFKGLVLRVALRGIEVLGAADFDLQSGMKCQGTASVVPKKGSSAEGTGFSVKGTGFSPYINPTQTTGALAPEEHLPEDSSIAPARVLYQAAAGEEWDAFVERTVQDNCAGVECLAGIPGTVGGTPVQNVGAYGQEAASAIERVRAFDLQTHSFVEFSAAECGFAYRRSRFNSVDRERYVVTRVDYRLTPGGAPTVRYADLQRVLAEKRKEGGELSLAEVAAIVRRVRQTKGMLMVEGDPDCHSAGSFFKNPLVSEEQFQRIAAVSAALSGKLPPRFPAGPEAENLGLLKVPAAWLIEQSGFAKGYALGAAAISSRHTLALTNRGGASSADVLALAAAITAAVQSRFGIKLEMEPVMVGF
jgi:UDP-N-acetylmuramate dehydrogenase